MSSDSVDGLIRKLVSYAKVMFCVSFYSVLHLSVQTSVPEVSFFLDIPALVWTNDTDRTRPGMFARNFGRTVHNLWLSVVAE